MSGGLIYQFMRDVARLSSQNPDGVVYHAKLVKCTGVSSRNAPKWLNNCGWHPINKGSAKKPFIEKCLPPPVNKRDLNND